MPTVSAKRQVTIPKDLCLKSGIEPGDQCKFYLDNLGNITIVKKNSESARGILKGASVDDEITDEESRQSSFRS